MALPLSRAAQRADENDRQATQHEQEKRSLLITADDHHLVAVTPATRRARSIISRHRESDCMQAERRNSNGRATSLAATSAELPHLTDSL